MEEIPFNLNISGPLLMTEPEPNNWYFVCVEWHAGSHARTLCSIECGVGGKCWVCSLASVMCCGAMKMLGLG